MKFGPYRAENEFEKKYQKRPNFIKITLFEKEKHIMTSFIIGIFFEPDHQTNVFDSLVDI